MALSATNRMDRSKLFILDTITSRLDPRFSRRMCTSSIRKSEISFRKRALPCEGCFLKVRQGGRRGEDRQDRPWDEEAGVKTDHRVRESHFSGCNEGEEKVMYW